MLRSTLTYTTPTRSHMKSLLVSLITMIIFASPALAQKKADSTKSDNGSFTLVDNINNKTYTCTPSNGQPPGNPRGESCVTRVMRACKVEYSSGCYESATNLCKGKSPKYGGCVEDTFNACHQEFSSGCYDSARGQCKE